MKSKLYKKLLNLITDNFIISIHVFVINKLNIENTNYLWCKPRDLVGMQSIIKIGICSWKVKIGLIGMWDNENLPQGTTNIRMKLNDTIKPINLR